ncbi:MAG: type II toxin-antitoxin system HicB family antitoxin [Lachnospiraceae bacterium]|nr:type II toxin-antitoxin system HicB family antitoxin [Lachnospiraceae bacterium]
MKNNMQYRGYVGSVELSEYDTSLFGKVQGIQSLIMYEGKDARELIADFHGAVDEYLKLCEEKGIAPEKPFKGSFNVRIGCELHRDAAIYAMEHEQSLNTFVMEAIKEKLASA